MTEGRNSCLCTKGVTTMITPGERWIQLEDFSPRDGYRSMGVIIRWRRGSYKILFFTIRVLKKKKKIDIFAIMNWWGRYEFITPAYSYYALYYAPVVMDMFTYFVS
jgi:hypothetical protein